MIVYILLILSIKKTAFFDSGFMFHIPFRTRIYFCKCVIVFLCNVDYLLGAKTLVLNTCFMQFMLSKISVACEQVDT
jgi:hypothetical protein